ncbi:MAG: prolyl oligopeptidase family serine peptidase [Candidatus Rifleibacteriota bacterium]
MAQKKNSKRACSYEDLKKFIVSGDAQISPDGSKIIFVRTTIGDKNKRLSSIWLSNLESGETKEFTNGENDCHPRWSPDGRKIAFLRTGSDKKTAIYMIEIDGGEAKAVSALPEGQIGGFKWSPDGRHLAFKFRETAENQRQKAQKEREEKGLSTPPIEIDQLWYRMDGDGYFNKQRFHLFLLDPESKKHRVLFDKAPDGAGAYCWSPDGKKIAFTANMEKEPMLSPYKERLYSVSIANGKHKLLPKQKDGSLGNIGWSPDGKYLAFSGRLGKAPAWASKNELLYLFDLKKSTYKCLSDKEDYCLGATVIGDISEAVFGANFTWSPDSKYIYCNFGWHGDRHISRISVKGGKFNFLTSDEGTHGLSNISDDGKKFAIISGNHADPGEVYLGQLKGNKIARKQLTNFNKDLLSEINLSQPETSWIKSPDGNKIQVWEMKPLNFRKNKKYPAILQIHGGPHALYGNSFFHEFQVLAANGFVVYFSNPRGSKGYGEKHCDAIAGNWGDKDWIDVQAVHKHIKKQKHVNPKKIGVMGGSYGGYMTNWAIGHTNEFAAAITDRCVSNMLSMMGTSDFVTMPDSYWPGNWWDKIDDFWRQSPIRYMGKADTPTLIIHSEGDLRCNIEQGEQVFTLLKVRKVPTRFVRYPRNTSHGMSRKGPADLRIHRLTEIVNWMNKWLK